VPSLESSPNFLYLYGCIVLETFLDIFSSDVTSEDTLNCCGSMIFKLLLVVTICLMLDLCFIFQTGFSRMVSIETQSFLATRKLNDIA